MVGEFPRNSFTRELRSLESKLNREINFVAYTRGEFEKEKKKEGGFLNLVLKDKVIAVKGAVGA